MDEFKRKRAMLNTTIDSEVLSNFREYCKNIGCPMNVVLEVFMGEFSEGKFGFKLVKNKMEIDIEE